MAQQRTRAKVRRYFCILLIVLLSALIGAASALVVMIATSAGTVSFERWGVLIHVAGPFAAFGAILGTIAALDRSSGSEFVPQWLGRPVKEVIQQAGRIRRWAPIAEMEGRYLRAILLPDGETVPNAFFDRSFTL